MSSGLNGESVNAFRSAFGVSPRYGFTVGAQRDTGIFGWFTPSMDGFALPPSGDLVVALHLGGSNRVRALTPDGLSRQRSMPGRLTVLPPEISATFDTGGSVSLVSLHVPYQRIQGGWLQKPYFAFEDAYASAAMKVLSDLANRRSSVTHEYVRAVTEALLCHLHDRCDDESHSPQEDVFGRLLAHIEANLGEHHSLESMAAHCKWSPRRVTRAFQARGESSPHQYLIRRRIERAKVLLRDGVLGTCYIAHELGFSSHSHFAAVFRAITGLTPGEYCRGAQN